MTNEDNPIPLITPDNSAAHSGDVAGENVATLKALFPQIVTDGKVDFDVLRQLLGDAVEVGEERYGLNWKGKAKARAHALTPTLATLRPAKEDSMDWNETRNLVIEGDNLEVLKTLRKAYSKAVRLIYIDPPYNTGTNIIYKNDYSEPLASYLAMTGEKSEGSALTSNPRHGGRFHTNWLNMILPVIQLGKDLLHDEGVFILTIDENELASVSLILKEIFGEGEYAHSYVSIVHNPRGQQGKNFSYINEYAIIIYRDNGKKYLADVPKKEVDARTLRDSGTESDRTDARNCFYPILVKDGKVVGFGDVPDDDFHPTSTNVIRDDGIMEVWPISDTGEEKKWRYARQSVEAIWDKLVPKMGRNSVQIIFNKDEGTVRSVWQDARYDASEYGTKLLDSLFKGASFTYPKSLYAVLDSVNIATKHHKDAIVLDYFAGSGTTGHAVMEQNARDGGKRRYILVQLPVPLDAADPEQRGAVDLLDKLGHPRNIAELTKERLRRAGAKVKADHPGMEIDTGFRVYKLDSSNLKPWQPNPDDLQGSLLDAVSNIIEDRSEEDLLVELLLKTGIDITTPEELRQIAGKNVHALGGGALIVCLADISEDIAEALGHGLAEWQRELDPAGQTTFYFKDTGFASASAKANVAAILRQRLGDKIAKLASI